MEMKEVEARSRRPSVYFNMLESVADTVGSQIRRRRESVWSKTF